MVAVFPRKALDQNVVAHLGAVVVFCSSVVSGILV